MSGLAVGVDLGGTKIAGGLVDAQGRVQERSQVSSPTTSSGDILDAICEVASSLLAGQSTAVGIGAAGIVDFATGYYTFGPNVGLRDLRLADELSSRLGVEVIVDNDANTAAWAEHAYGAGRGTRDFLCVTLGTGIGGGLVVDGRPYRGARGGAGEIGHMLVDPSGPMCGCGRRGCWEQFASGTALERLAREALARGADGKLREAVGGDPAGLDGRMVTDAARAGDELARQVLDELARWVGWGLASLVNILEPERIAIAGGLATDWDLLADAAVSAMTDRTEASSARQLPSVTAAELGSDAGFIGAAWLVHEARRLQAG